jgi:hypothetical protein
MKKTLIVFFVAIASICNAQLSLKFGLIRSKIQSTQPNFLTYDAKITPLFGGIYYRIKAGNLFGLETGLQYQGYSEKYELITAKRHNVSVPIAISYKPSSFISPGIGIQLSQTLTKNSTIPNPQANYFDLMLLGKVNINPFNSIGLELGYNIGLIPFVSYTVTDTNGKELGDQSLSNQYMYVALKYTM